MLCCGGIGAGFDMKIRIGFVSNSSSASFVLDAIKLSPKQIQQVLDFHGMKEGEEGDEWNIRKEGDLIIGDTTMDNFGITDYLWSIGIPREAMLEYECD